jgi:leucyl aminopeptidase
VASLSLSARSLASVKADAVVVGVASGAGAAGPRLLGTQDLPDELRTGLQATLRPLGITGAVDTVHRVPSGGGTAAPVIALTGLGAVRGDGPIPAEVLRRAAGAATRALTGLSSVALALPAPDTTTLAAVAEGALLGAYTFDRYRVASSAPAKQPVGSVILMTPSTRSADVKAAMARAEIVAVAVNAARDLVNTAPVDLYPAALAEAALAAVADVPVTATVLDERKLRRGGYGGLLGVGKGSARPPRLVRLDYSPAGARAHLAYVGKGITFDSGGLSIKPAAGMEAMKSDMSGAAAVLHAVVAVARLGLPVRVTGWLAIAENMPSGTAQRPSDVITIRGGRTVEVLNTDAEGRLVLADAIVAASEEEPDVIVDVATLTGAQVVALGNRVSAVMANDDELRSRIHRVADQAGEQFWPMPLPPELRSSMDSTVADIANMGERSGGMLVAGLFLAEFVPERAGAAGGNNKLPWAHLDIAGPAFNTGSGYGYTPPGGTGVSVRTLLAFAEDVVAQGLAPA